MATKNTEIATRQSQDLALKNDPFVALHKYTTDKYNVLTPITSIDQLPQGAKLSVRVVQIDPRPVKAGGDTYSLEEGKLALGGTALNRISAAAGISWIRSEQTDGRKHPHLVEYQVTGRLVDFDGSIREFQGTRCVDLRDNIGDGTPGADLAEIINSAKNAKDRDGNKKPRNPDKQILFARKFIVPICESKAKNRAIRHALSIKGGYTAQELQKPFVVPKLIVDTNDQQAKNMVMNNIMGAASALYGTQPRRQIIDMTPGPSGVYQTNKTLDDDDDDNDRNQPPQGESKNTKPVTDAAPPKTETPPPTELEQMFNDVWAQAQKNGFSAATFKALCLETCGRASRKDLTPEDLLAIAGKLSEKQKEGAS